jgi:hypothetical protein
MTVLADEHQALLGAIGIRGIPTHRARLARVVRVYFDRHRAMQEGFIGNHALQLGKSPLRVSRIRLSLLLRSFLAFLASGAFADICQVLQAEQAMGVPINDASSDHVIGILLQPSLSSTHDNGSSCSRASAFLVQMLPQSHIMVSFGYDTFARMKGMIPSGSSSDRQVAYSYIHTYHTRMGVRYGVRSSSREISR